MISFIYKVVPHMVYTHLHYKMTLTLTSEEQQHQHIQQKAWGAGPPRASQGIIYISSLSTRAPRAHKVVAHNPSCSDQFEGVCALSSPGQVGGEEEQTQENTPGSYNNYLTAAYTFHHLLMWREA